MRLPISMDVNASLMHSEPRSVLKLLGQLQAGAASITSMQNADSIVFESRPASTRRRYQTSTFSLALFRGWLLGLRTVNRIEPHLPAFTLEVMSNRSEVGE